MTVGPRRKENSSLSEFMQFSRQINLLRILLDAFFNSRPIIGPVQIASLSKAIHCVCRLEAESKSSMFVYRENNLS